MACAAAERDFSSSSLVAQPLGLSFGFGPTSACAPPSGLCSPPRQEVSKAAADWGTYSLRLGRDKVGTTGVCVKCLRQTGRKLQHTGEHSLHWECLSVPTKAGAGRSGRGSQWRPCPLHTTQQWHLASKSDHVSSRSIPSCGAPHSHPLRLSLHSQQWSSPWICSHNPTL